MFTRWFKTLNVKDHVFVSPDVGNVKRAQIYANLFGGELCIIDKRRKSGSEIEAAHIIGDVRGRTVLMTDDMITTAGTVTKACDILRANGAGDIYISATHGVFAPPALERLAKCDFTKLAVTDTIPMNGRCARRSPTAARCSALPTCSARRFTAFTTTRA